MKAFLFVLLLSFVAFSGCTEPPQESTRDDDPVRLFAYRGDTDLRPWSEDGQRLPSTHELYLVPTPGAEARPDTCSVLTTNTGATNASCTIRSSDEVALPVDSQTGHNVEYTCDGSGKPPLPWNVSGAPATYHTPWVVALNWTGDDLPTKDAARAVLGNWSAAVEGGSLNATWNGEVSPCYQWMHTDHLFPPLDEHVNWTWHGSNASLGKVHGEVGVSFSAGVGRCMRIDLVPIVDALGYSVELRRDGEAIWRHNESADPTRVEPTRLQDVAHVLTDHSPGTMHRIEFRHEPAPPPEQSPSRTSVHVKVTETLAPDC